MQSEIPGDLKFNRSHEWARVEEDGTITVGISEHAAAALGDLVYVELPAVGDSVKAGDSVAVVESVKAASDVYSPVNGEIVRVNEALGDAPETINGDAYGAGWMFIVKATSDSGVDALLAPDDYAQMLEDADH